MSLIYVDITDKFSHHFDYKSCQKHRYGSEIDYIIIVLAITTNLQTIDSFVTRGSSCPDIYKRRKFAVFNPSDRGCAPAVTHDWTGTEHDGNSISPTSSLEMLVRCSL
jgi:hypothetical protein